jgi:cysteine synthase A
MIEAAEKSGELQPGGTIFEGTGGNTGVGLALVAAAKGYKAVFAMSATLGKEKIDAMTGFGSEVVLCRGGFATETHYFHTAARLARETQGGFWTNQFDNDANMQSQIDSTGPEIWRDTEGKIDGCICSSGTGGTISGMSQYLKSQNPDIVCAIIDCEGSALLDYVNTPPDEPVPDSNVNGYITKLVKTSPGDSIAEGIGINRLTKNFLAAKIDMACQGTNQEAVDMAYFLQQSEGVHVGPSAALNVVGAVKLARQLGPGKTIVTVLCDAGNRYLGKLYDPAYLEARNLTVDPAMIASAEALRIGPWNARTPAAEQ